MRDNQVQLPPAWVPVVMWSVLFVLLFGLSYFVLDTYFDKKSEYIKTYFEEKVKYEQKLK